jgi:DNA-binding NtrC family response regulator
MRPGPPKETLILVVHDDAAVLGTIVTILNQANFHVLPASNGADAITLAREFNGDIHLLLSKVDGHAMSGPDLGEALKKSRPEIHVMLISASEGGNLLVLNYGWAFIQQPFVAARLVQMIADVLHAPDRSQLGGQEFESSKDTFFSR